MINFGILPLFVDLFVEFEDYRRKSSKQISIMRKIQFLLFVNLFLVPISGRQLADYFSKIETVEQDLLSLPQLVAEQFMS